MIAIIYKYTFFSLMNNLFHSDFKIVTQEVDEEGRIQVW